MKVLVLGSTGMAGHMIALYLGEQGHDVWGLNRSKDFLNNSIIVDFNDLNALKKIIIDGEYDVIINAVGILNADAETHKSQAVYINAFLPHFISDATRDMKTKFIHLSTDCVFSGQKGSYTENSFKDGNTFYDKTKSLGEVINDKDLTFRMSIIGPDRKEQGIGLLNWFMKQKSKVKGYSKVYWTGVTTLTLAKAIDKAMQSKLTGLYHLVNNEKIAKYDLLKLFNAYLKSDKIGIEAFENEKVDKSLINTRNDFLFKVPSYEEMVKELAQWIKNHQDIYPTYYNEG